MPRTPLMAGNWKMNTRLADAAALARDVAAIAENVTSVETAVCPPFVYLQAVREALKGSRVALGAQHSYWQEQGAFTGEVSIAQLAELVRYVIAGHSERRQYFGETDETVNQRVRAILAHGLRPIMCVGETLDQRNADQTSEVLTRQVRGGLDGIDVTADVVIAYEPVWAIGTGLAADGATAQKAVSLIRETVREVAGAVAGDVRILYGGSVTPENIAEFMAQPDIDGGLVGGASLKADSFGRLITLTASAAR